MRERIATTLMTAALLLGTTARAHGQAGGSEDVVPYAAPPSWQRAAIAELDRRLPTDSGYWALGPLDVAADAPDTTNLVRSTLRIIVPDGDASRSIARRLWVPTGGIALQELQPGDTLPVQPPPGYTGRFLRGTLVGQPVYVQVFTVQAHRWLLWAEQVLVTQGADTVRGPIVRYSEAVGRYLTGLSSGSSSTAPAARDFDLAPGFDLFAELPAPVIRDRAGYEGLLAQNRAFALDDRVKDVYGIVPAPPLEKWLEGEVNEVLRRDQEGEAGLQRRYRDYRAAGGIWTGLPVLSPETLARLRPGRYAYAVDRYDVIRVGRLPASGDTSAATITPALLVHGEPVRVAGELTVGLGPDGRPRLTELDIRSEEYLFSNLSLSIYDDVSRRSDDYLQGMVGHVLRALDAAGLSRDNLLIRKF